MRKDHIKLIWVLTALIGFSLACQSLSAIRDDYDQARGTVGSIATQAQQIITQAQGIATQFDESEAMATARALATEHGPAVISTGQALATQVADEGYLKTAEARSYIDSQLKSKVNEAGLGGALATSTLSIDE